MVMFVISKQFEIAKGSSLQIFTSEKYAIDVNVRKTKKWDEEEGNESDE